MGFFDLVNILVVRMSTFQKFLLCGLAHIRVGKSGMLMKPNPSVQREIASIIRVCLVNFIMFIFRHPFKIIFIYCHDICS